jgi:hypothetical protein
MRMNLVTCRKGFRDRDDRTGDEVAFALLHDVVVKSETGVAKEAGCGDEVGEEGRRAGSFCYGTLQGVLSDRTHLSKACWTTRKHNHWTEMTLEDLSKRMMEERDGGTRWRIRGAGIREHPRQAPLMEHHVPYFFWYHCAGTVV